MIFAQTGRDNTAEVAKAAVEAARAHKIGHIVVASNKGETVRALPVQEGIGVVCVTHAFGYPRPGEMEMPQAEREELERTGVRVLTTSHVLSGAERGLSKKYGGIHPVEVIADTLRMFGAGTKVCVEVAVMALDAGLLPYGEPVVAVGGTGRGADTALILTPAHASEILNVKIHEYICKPGLY